LAIHPSKLCFDKQALNALLATLQLEFSTPSPPAKLRKDIFLHLHISHPRRLAYRRLVSSKFVWSELSNDITNWARSCLHRQQGKIHCHIRMLPQPIPQWRFAHLHISLVGPLQYSNGCNHIFMIIDHTSKWMEAIPLTETSAASYALALVFSWITRNDHFTSNIWSQLCECYT
jgi:hypothetical protein